ncbi:MAG: FHA domain-containing protein [Cytophagales bacterium]|nr:MAG: FHA domain-containing protein [Cytophagales bacterium]
MPLIDNLKNLFGLGTPPAETPPTAPAESQPARSALPQTPQQRDVLFRFIVESLSAYTSETESLPTGITLWLRADDKADEDRLNVALYAAQPGHFRAELGRHLANHYIRLAPDWAFNWRFTADTLPDICAYQQGDLGLQVIRPETEKPLRALLRTLTGQTVQTSYLLDPNVQTEYRIGRGRMVQTASGRVRTNDIAFIDSSEPDFDPQRGEANLTVSRQHATIRYDAAKRQYRLFADAGGLPANNNKTKILRANDTVDRADLPGIGYLLSPDDQIELGGEAKLLFVGE